MWFLVVMMMLLCMETFMRYVLNNPTTYSYETSMMTGVAVGAGGLAYTHLHDGHIRVDVLWRTLPLKVRLITDILGSIVFMWPLMGLLVWDSAKWVIYSYSVKEISMQSYLYPIVWPVRVVVLLGFFLLIPQDIAKFIRNIYQLRGKELA